jgi:hypothetical protein
VQFIPLTSNPTLRATRKIFPPPAWVFLLGATTALAAVPVTPRFDLAAAPQPLVVEKSLYDRYHVMQSFAFDSRNGEIYAVQVEGADAAGTWPEHDKRGDLTLSRLGADGGSVLGHMYLRGFGHGVAMAVEPFESGVFLWTEVDSRPNGGDSGRGLRLGRFAFVDGTTLEAQSSAITKYSLVDGAVSATPGIDTLHGRLAVRYAAGGGFHVALFSLAAVKAGNRTPLAKLVCPSDVGTFQGWATWGSYVYFYAGNNYSATNPPPGNAMLHCYDWNTGREVQRFLTRAFPSQLWREPEGIAVRTNGAHPQLVFGVSSHSPASNGRTISLAAIERFVP